MDLNLQGAACAAALALLAWPAQAQAPASVGDIRCIAVVGNLVGASDDPGLRAAAPIMLAYYYGRLKGREPDLTLEPVIVPEARRMAGEDMRSEARRCAIEMDALSKETRALSEALAEEARRLSGASKP